MEQQVAARMKELPKEMVKHIARTRARDVVLTPVSRLFATEACKTQLLIAATLRLKRARSPRPRLAFLLAHM